MMETFTQCLIMILHSMRMRHDRVRSMTVANVFISPPYLSVTLAPGVTLDTDILHIKSISP